MFQSQCVVWGWVCVAAAGAVIVLMLLGWVEPPWGAPAIFATTMVGIGVLVVGYERQQKSTDRIGSRTKKGRESR